MTFNRMNGQVLLLQTQSVVRKYYGVTISPMLLEINQFLKVNLHKFINSYQ